MPVVLLFFQPSTSNVPVLTINYIVTLHIKEWKLNGIRHSNSNSRYGRITEQCLQHSEKRKWLSTSNSIHKVSTRYESYMGTFLHMPELHNLLSTHSFTVRYAWVKWACNSKRGKNMRRQKIDLTQESSEGRSQDYWWQRPREQPFQKEQSPESSRNKVSREKGRGRGVVIRGYFMYSRHSVCVGWKYEIHRTLSLSFKNRHYYSRKKQACKEI